MNTKPIVAMSFALLIGHLTGCASTATRPALISHVVFVDLQDPGDIPELIADSDATLAHIPGVVSYAAGPPIDTGRDTVLDDYHVGLYIGFDSEAAYTGYVTHPDHVGFVARWRPRLTALRVYDFQDDSP